MNVEVEKRMSWLNKRCTEFEKRRLYVNTTNKWNFDRKNASRSNTYAVCEDRTHDLQISVSLDYETDTLSTLLMMHKGIYRQLDLHEF